MIAALAQAAAPALEAPGFTLDPIATPDVLGAWLVSFFTLAVFSFLYRDNPFYKLAEHVFVGLGTAYFTLQYYEEGVLQPLYEYIHAARLRSGTDELVSLGGLEIAPALAIAFRLGAVVLGLMLLVRMVKPGSWAPRWPLAVMVGVYAALKMTGETQSKFVLLLGNQFKSLVDPAAPGWSEAARVEQTGAFFVFARLVFFVGLICALGHFVFTFRRTRGLAAVSRVGVITLMITFGSMFGFTVLGRIALLIERIDDLHGYTAPAYSLAAAGPDPGLGAALLSPPVLLGALIVALLALGALGRRRPAA
ncbi:MAG TPA: hypothetical protein VFD43_07380 [Planctomycetota bacterium]|nr:hypothetical protein [Planctomycetota bacterium]